MKTATLIFRLKPEEKAILQKQFEASRKAAEEAYNKVSNWNSKAWDRYHEHPKNLGAWVLACALIESNSRTKNIKALKDKVKT